MLYLCLYRCARDREWLATVNVKTQKEERNALQHVEMEHVDNHRKRYIHIANIYIVETTLLWKNHISCWKAIIWSRNDIYKLLTIHCHVTLPCGGSVSDVYQRFAFCFPRLNELSTCYLDFRRCWLVELVLVGGYFFSFNISHLYRGSFF